MLPLCPRPELVLLVAAALISGCADPEIAGQRRIAEGYAARGIPQPKPPTEADFAAAAGSASSSATPASAPAPNPAQPAAIASLEQIQYLNKIARYEEERCNARHVEQPSRNMQSKNVQENRLGKLDQA